MSKPEVIYHLAFRADAQEMMRDPTLSLKNITMSVSLLEISRKARVKKFIFASSGAVYGSLNPVSFEIEPVKIVNPYAAAKASVETYVKMYGEQLGLPTIILRYPVVYGPRQALGHVADYILRLKSSQAVEMWGDGNKTRDYVYVEDLVEANILAMDLPGDGQIYNVGSGIPTTLNRLFELIKTNLGVEGKILYHKDRPGEIEDCVLDSSKFRFTTRWEPKVSLEDGIKLRLEEFK
jgi:UDP-glucose 4-epimerase